jgi:hypothetical protein
MYSIRLPNNNCFTNFGTSYYGMIDFQQFKDMFFPNMSLTLVTSSADIAVHGINSDISTDNRINILISCENLTNPRFTWYSHYNTYGEYGNDAIQLYIYNHISRLVKTERYTAIPFLYFRMHYFKERYLHYFQHPRLQRPFAQKRFCLKINKSGLNPDIAKATARISAFGQIDDISMYNKYISNASCYNSMELLEVFNNYKFILCFENSYNSGYITEKIFNVFFAKAVPIYCGSDQIDRYFTAESFIRPDDVARLNALHNDEALYNAAIHCQKIRSDYDDEHFLEEMQRVLMQRLQ